MNDETLISFGGAVKALGGGRFEAPLVTFGQASDPDLTRDYFTKQTDFWREFPETVPLLYAHGLDDTMKKTKIGGGKTTLDMKDDGVWMRGQLDLANRYEARIYELIEQKKMGTSSGSASHMVERKQVGNAFEVTSWPITEASLTPQPAEPKNYGQVRALKSLELTDEAIKDVMTTADGYAPANNRNAAGMPPAAPQRGATGPENGKNEMAPGRDSGSVECPACHLHCHFDADHKQCPYCGQTLSLSSDGVPLAGAKKNASFGVPFAEELDAALAAAESCRVRAESISQYRLKTGRVLSGANREKLSAIHGTLTEMLRLTEQTPEPADTSTAARLAADLAIADSERTIRLLGL